MTDPNNLIIPQSDEEENQPTECRNCHYTNVTDDWFYECPTCGRETCCDCAGSCGCDDSEENAVSSRQADSEPRNS